MKEAAKTGHPLYQLLVLKINILSRAVVGHAFDPSTWEAEAGGFLSSRPAWSTE
jgi:major histocompatibility complex class I